MQVSFSRKDICMVHTMHHTTSKSGSLDQASPDEKSHGTWESIFASYPNYLWKMVSMQHSYSSHVAGLTMRTASTALSAYDSIIERTMKSLGASEPHQYTTGHLTQQMLSDTLRLALKNNEVLTESRHKPLRTPATTLSQ